MHSTAAIEPDAAMLLLKQADSIKTSNHAEFNQIMAKLESQRDALPPAEAMYLRYLQGWKIAYDGDYAGAIPVLNGIIDSSTDAALRFRAGATVVNMLAIARRYEEAYGQLGKILDLLARGARP
ncbi:hypothetical protein PEC18_37400 [Paucibacter sp. O1-1]|nr:hypothetical protein [Paucibacter sp. O1-1]MDA3831327.1 hypothetical protein [Paucibacter sp. O1-1]